MVNLCRLVTVLKYVVLTIQLTAASDVVNGLTFSMKLIEHANNLLGVQKMQQIVDEYAHIYTVAINGSKTVQKVARGVSSKFNDAFKALDNIADAVMTDYNSGPLSRVGIKKCCHVRDNETEYNFAFKKRVDMTNLCYRIAAESDKSEQVPTSAELLNTFRNADKKYLKWQYFGTEGGLIVTYPARQSGECGAYDPRFRPWYAQTSIPIPKDMVIIIDRSESMNTDKKISTAKEAAKTVIGTLNANDRIGVVGWLSGDITTPSGCYSKELAYATVANKKDLNAYVDQITADGNTNYIQTLTKAFTLLKENMTENRYKTILFLADGGAEETNSYILETIKKLNDGLNNKVVILTYGIGDLDPAAETLLKEMANHTFAGPNKGDTKRGTYTAVPKSMSLNVRLGSYYNIFSSFSNDSSYIITTPYIDYSGLGIVISVCKAVYNQSNLLGIAAVDLRLTDLLTEATYYDGGEYSYSFIIDNSGRTLVHPLLLKPSVSITGRDSVDISSLEPNNVVKDVISSMKSGGEGGKELVVRQVQSRGNPYKDGVNSFLVKAMYYWKQIEKTGFSVCIVVTENSHLTKTNNRATCKRFVYHRLDLKHNVALCSIRKKKLATSESSVVKFTGNAFLDPGKYFNIKENIAIVKKYEDYMTGKAISGNNIKDGVRQFVALSEDLDKVWKSRGGSFWRYIAFINGAIRMYPGPIFATNYDHTARRWYQSSVAHRDVTVLTPPYIDALGNGVVLSLCRALYQSRKSWTHSPKDTVVGVIAMDFKLANIKTMLSQLFPACNKSDMSCFLVDTSGFLVYHDDFINPNNKRLVSVHIAEKEGNIANDLIQNNYMKQNSCRSVTNKIIYNTWKIDITMKINKLQDSSLAYSLEVVAATNIFLGVKKTDPQRHQICGSCPNTADGELQRCNSDDSQWNERKQCHCPCFLDADFQNCQNVFVSKSKLIVPCTPVEEHVIYSSPVKNETTWAEQYSSCYATECTVITIKRECVSYDDCQWCGGETDQPCRKRGSCPLPQTSSGLGFGGIIGISLGALCLLVIAVVVIIRRRQLPSTQKSVDEPTNQDFNNLSTEVSRGECGSPPPHNVRQRGEQDRQIAHSQLSNDHRDRRDNDKSIYTELNL